MRLIITTVMEEGLLSSIVATELIRYYSKDVTPFATPQDYLDAAKELWGANGVRVPPHRSKDGPWWELDGTNNHKLDILGDGRYAFRDRYNVPAKRQWIEKALKELGIEVSYE